MARDLFTTNLESIDQDDVASFLGIHLPPEQRPTEGQRFDFKELLPENLGEDVAAFANTFGGLLVLGVEPHKSSEKKKEKNIPGALIGLEGTELKLRVTQMIRDSIYPVPAFEVAAHPLKTAPGRSFVVVRVEPGGFPPYMFIKNRRNSIPIRRGDGTEMASPLDLEGLLARRQANAEEKRERLLAEDIHVLQILPDQQFQYPNQQLTRARNFQAISLVPWHFPRINLDSNIERRIELFIKAVFVRDRLTPLSALSIVKSVRARWVEYDLIDHKKLIHRKWRITQDGVISFVSTIPYGDEELLGNLVVDFFSALKLANLFHSEFECFGNLDLRSEVSSIDAGLSLKTPVLTTGVALPNTHDMQGINLRRKTPAKTNNTWIYLTRIANSQLSSPVDIATLVFSEHLREIWQGEFKAEGLRSQLASFWEDQFLANLPRGAGAPK